MNTKILMVASSVFLGATGALLNFAPMELSQLFQWQTAPIFLQILGSAYFGFAMLNWMARANLIGGIYSRPVAIGNFCHFMVGGFAMFNLGGKDQVLLIFSVIYLVFAACFAYILFTHPKAQPNREH